MPLVHFNELMERAAKGRYAVGYFESWDMESMLAVAAAAEALLANYRANPAGERAADSLYYLGQSLMKLGQATRACNAYGELESVYGTRMRDELKRLLPPAKAEAKCD